MPFLSSRNLEHVPGPQAELCAGDAHPWAALHLPVAHCALDVPPVVSGLVGVEGVDLPLANPDCLPGLALGSTSGDS